MTRAATLPSGATTHRVGRLIDAGDIWRALLIGAPPLA
jgi:hypothetical protein